MALGKLPSCRAPPEEGKGKPLLSILYLESPEKGCHMSELTMMMMMMMMITLAVTNNKILAKEYGTELSKGCLL